MKKKSIKQGLKLSAEKIRALTQTQLVEAAGGAPTGTCPGGDPSVGRTCSLQAGC